MENEEPLTTYLRMYRRKTGLTQDDVAFLLGMVTSASLCRHESGERLPLLRTVIGYEMVLGIQVSDLYEGVSKRVAKGMVPRAMVLISVLKRQPATKERDQKLSFLIALLRRRQSDPQQTEQ